MTLGPDPIPLHVGNSSMRALVRMMAARVIATSCSQHGGGVFRRHTMYHFQWQKRIDHMTLKDYNFLFIYKPG